MESEIEYLRSELEASKIREETIKKLYESVMKFMDNESSENVLVYFTQAQSAIQLKSLQDTYKSECESLKINHAAAIRTLHETIHKQKDTIKDLEFQVKSDTLNYQQQILNLKTEIFHLKSDLALLQTLKKNSESE
jgi:hypothetical protein